MHIAYFGFSESLWRNQKHRCCFFTLCPLASSTNGTKNSSPGLGSVSQERFSNWTVVSKLYQHCTMINIETEKWITWVILTIGQWPSQVDLSGKPSGFCGFIAKFLLARQFIMYQFYTDILQSKERESRTQNKPKKDFELYCGILIVAQAIIGGPSVV